MSLKFFAANDNVFQLLVDFILPGSLPGFQLPPLDPTGGLPSPRSDPLACADLKFPYKIPCYTSLI